MKQNYLSLFLLLFVGITLFSCQKEPREVPDEPTVILDDNLQLRSFGPFFQADFVSSTLGFNTNRNGTYQDLENMKADLSVKYNNDAFLPDLASQNLYPCWDCAEPEYLGFINFYIPVYDIQENDLKALLIGQFRNQEYSFYYLNKEVVTQLKTFTRDGFIAYWEGIFSFFDLPLNYSNRSEVFASRMIPCYNSEITNGCICGIDYEECGTITPDCDGLFCDGSDGGGGGGGEDPHGGGEDPLEFADITDWIRTWSNSDSETGVGGGGGGSSNGPHNQGGPPPNWDGYGDNFNGELPDESDSNVVDEENGIISIMNPRDLYLLQIENFIAQYNLSYTVDEILAIVPNDCAVSLVSEVNNCVKYHLINHTLGQYSLTNITEADKWYIFDHFEIYQDFINILVENGGDDYARSSVELYAKLARNDLLDLTYEEIDNNNGTIQSIFDGVLNTNNLSDRLALSASTWYAAFEKEAAINGGSRPAKLQAYIDGLKDFWDIILAPVKLALEPILSALEAANMPNTLEEWQALMAVFGPTLIHLGVDIATDFIPVIGEMKAFYKSGAAFSEGKYGEAALEFIGGVAGVIPIGDLIRGAGKVTTAAISAFAGYKVIKALSKISSGIFVKIRDLVQSGWKVIWDDGLEKLLFKNGGGDEVAEIFDDAEDLVPNTRVRNAVARDLLDINALKNCDEVDISTTSTQSLANEARKNPANHLRFEPGDLQSQVDDIIQNGDNVTPPGPGQKTEELMRAYIDGNDGWVHQTGGKYGSDNGYDNVFYNPNTGEVLIDESKNWPPVLSGENINTGLPKQMSDLWITRVANQIRDNGDTVLAGIIEGALQNGKLIKTVSAIKKTEPGLGTIVTIKVGG